MFAHYMHNYICILAYRRINMVHSACGTRGQRSERNLRDEIYSVAFLNPSQHLNNAASAAAAGSTKGTLKTERRTARCLSSHPPYSSTSVFFSSSSSFSS